MQPTTTSVVPTVSRWKTQLITHEDPGHIHKALGLACLASFSWRLSMAGEPDMGFATHSAWTLPTVLLHGSLTLSSFLFRIPKKRIATGDRIWPEYRLHAMVFLSRSLAIILLYYYEEIHQKEPNYDANLAIVLATLLAADLSSWSVGDQHRSGSIRDLEAHPAVQFFFSFMQFGATTGCLYGLRRYSLMFYFAFILQVTPFLMTLRRKNLVSKPLIITIYGVMLIGGMGVTIYELVHYTAHPFHSFLCQGVIINLATILRVGPRVPVLRYVLQDNKYLLWLSMGLLLRRIRPIFDQEELSNETVILCQFLRVSMVALGVWKGFLRRVDARKYPVLKSV